MELRDVAECIVEPFYKTRIEAFGAFLSEVCRTADQAG